MRGKLVELETLSNSETDVSDDLDSEVDISDVGDISNVYENRNP